GSSCGPSPLLLGGLVGLLWWGEILARQRAFRHRTVLFHPGILDSIGAWRCGERGLADFGLWEREGGAIRPATKNRAGAGGGGSGAASKSRGYPRLVSNLFSDLYPLPEKIRRKNHGRPPAPNPPDTRLPPALSTRDRRPAPRALRHRRPLPRPSLPRR